MEKKAFITRLRNWIYCCQTQNTCDKNCATCSYVHNMNIEVAKELIDYLLEIDDSDCCIENLDSVRDTISVKLNNTYFVKIDTEWKVFSGESLKDLVINIAARYDLNSELFNTAMIGFDENSDKCIELYNIFAPPVESISGIYKLDEFIYGDEE